MGDVRITLAQRGVALVREACRVNGWPLVNGKSRPEGDNRRPVLTLAAKLPPFSGATCGVYVPGRRARLCVDAHLCARPGYGGRAWSWPGYVVDRTPYGVHAHELGHHAEVMVRWRALLEPAHPLANIMGNPARRGRAETQEPALTSYCPNDHEWWAEMFRLFMTNSDLLRLVRPKTYSLFLRMGLVPFETRPWEEVLADAPECTRAAARGKIATTNRAVARR